MNEKSGSLFIAFLPLLLLNGCAPAQVGFIVIDANSRERLPRVHVESAIIASRYPIVGWIKKTDLRDAGVTADDGSFPTTSIAHNETLNFRADGYPMVKVRAHGSQVFVFRPPLIQRDWGDFLFERDDFDYSKCEIQKVRFGQPAVIEMKRRERPKSSTEEKEALEVNASSASHRSN